jgi:glutaconate CoA-transferase subunit B
VTIINAMPTDAGLELPASASEIMAVVVARDLADGEWVEVGANFPIPRAGALLAHLLHGPNMVVMLAMTKAWLRNEPSVDDFQFITDTRATRWAEAFYEHDRLVSEMRPRRRGVFFCGGIEIDKHGNSNLIGVGDIHSRLRFRGPGGIGTCNATAYNSRYHLVTTSHTPRVLVERCSFVSALGYGDGSQGLRKQLGLPGAGPRYIITPLCVFDFDPVTNAARLKSVHPGVTIDKVRVNTGFAFECPDDVLTTEPPTDIELTTLRTRIDRRGLMR